MPNPTHVTIERELYNDYRGGYILSRIEMHLIGRYVEEHQITLKMSEELKLGKIKDKEYDLQLDYAQGSIDSLRLVSVELQHTRNRIRHFDHELHEV